MIEVKPGYTIRVHQTIKEITPKGEEKERIQIFEGLVIRMRGAGASKTMTVRKISEGIGVERIYPLNLPSIVNIELVKVAKIRRAHLGFVRKSKKQLREKII